MYLSVDMCAAAGSRVEREKGHGFDIQLYFAICFRVGAVG